MSRTRRWRFLFPYWYSFLFGRFPFRRAYCLGSPIVPVPIVHTPLLFRSLLFPYIYK